MRSQSQAAPRVASRSVVAANCTARAWRKPKISKFGSKPRRRSAGLAREGI